MQTIKTTTGKRRLALFVAIIMALSLWTALPLTASADLTNGDYSYTINEDGSTVTITGYTGSGGDVTIPGTLDSKTVTAVGANAFGDKSSLTSVTIPAGITSIGTQAFQGCTSLTSVTMTSVTSIGDNAFYSCEKLASVTLPEGLTSIAVGTFAHNSLLASITIPDTVTSIGDNAFYNCRGLTSLTLSASVTSFPVSAVQGCSGITTINVDENNATYSSVGGVLFDKSETTPLYYPAGRTASSYTIPASVTNVSGEVFNGVQALTEITVENGNLFYSSEDGILFNKDKTSLVRYPAGKDGTTYTVPDSVTRLEVCAFRDSKKLKTLVLSNVKYIGASAIECCEALESITMDSVETIDEWAFQGCFALETITIPESVTSLGDYVFYNCKILKTLVIPNNVTSIGENTFIYCGALTDVTVPKAILDEGIKSMFPAADGITTVTIADGVTEIPAGAFDDMDSLTTVNIPNSVTTIGDNVFDDCEDITTVTVPQSVLDKGIDTVFSASKDEITTVTIADGVTNIPDDAFDGLANLEEIWCSDDSLLPASVSDKALIMIGSIALDRTSLALNFSDNKTAQLSVTYGPIGHGETAANNAEPTVAWSSSNEEVAVVTNGKVEARGYGSAVITASAATHSGVKTADCTVTVTQPAPTTYAVTVNSGTGSGSYAAGAKVNIVAANAPSGQVFDTWTTADEYVVFANANSAQTSFTMPAKNVTVTATYKDDPNAGGGDDPDDPNNPPATENGWVKQSDGTWKYYYDGEAETGWFYDTGYKGWFYLASNGTMQTGWEYVGGKWYYLAGNGAMKTGWVKDNGSWYYLSGNGVMVAAKWLKDTDGSWYYLSGNGKMLTGKQKIGAKTYSFKSNGVWTS
jgi:hypothetical protein